MRAGPRGHAVRERRLGHERTPRGRALDAPCGSTRTASTSWPTTSDARARRDRLRRLRSHPLPHRLPAFPLSRRVGVPHVTTLHGRLDMPDLPPLYREFATCRSCRSPTRSASRCRRRTGRRPSITACPTISTRSGGARQLLRVPGPDLAREARRPRDRDRAPHRACRSRSRPRSTRSTASTSRATIEPLLRAPHVEYVGEIGEAEKDELPRQRARAALSDRLAGAVRPRHDRGDGLRHAGHRVSPRLGARRSSTTASPASSSTTSTSAVQAVARVARSIGAACRARLRAALHRGADGRDYVAVYERSSAGGLDGRASRRPRAPPDRSP